MLKVNDCVIKYGDFTAVNNISFNVKPGKIFGLLGENGSGKTTTFRAIMGLMDPDQGTVTYNGNKVSYDTVNEIGYMIEERSLLTKLTVKELMMFYGQLKEMKPSLINERLKYWLERFRITEYYNKKIKELSKGNQQKIQFISAIINDPTLLVLDEPFSGLDVINVELFVEVIREFQAKGATIIFSSHQIDHVESFCEDLLVLRKGEALLQGKISDIKKDYKKHNIKIVGNIDVDVVKEIKGVYNIVENLNEYIIKIEDESVNVDVFNYIKTLNNITKYELEQASLSEIFIDKVGESYE